MKGLQGRTYDVCGIPISVDGPSVATKSIIRAGLSGVPFEVHLCNAYTLSLVRRDSELRQALLRADYNLPDGAPVAFLGRQHGVRGPVRGPGLVLDVVDQGRQAGLRHFLFGGLPGIGEVMADKLAEKFPGAEVVGIESPPFRDLEGREIREAGERMQAVGAGVVWVGLGTPRQDYLVPRLAAHAQCAVVPVGAAFDFIAGKVKEAPVVMQGTGTEWVHRLVKEPRRLWRRYLLGNPRFVLDVLRSRRGMFE